MAQGRRVITREIYDLLVAAYRDVPGNHARAAKRAGVWHGTSKKGWERGWPKHNFPAIRSVIEQDRIKARSLLETDRKERETQKMHTELEKASDEQSVQRVAEDQHTRDQAEVDAARALKEETGLVRAARHNSIGLQGVNAQLLQGGMKLAGKVKQILEDESIPFRDAIAALNAIASITRQGNEAGRIAMQMERVLVGQPEQILGVRIEMSLEDAKKEIAAAQQDLERAKELGIIDVSATESEISDALPAAV